MSLYLISDTSTNVKVAGHPEVAVRRQAGRTDVFDVVYSVYFYMLH